MNLEMIDEFSLTGVSALIVEDENLVAMDVESLLRDFGSAQVWSTGTLAQARQILARNPDISVVLLDLKLLDGSGEELFDELADAGVPFVVTTGYPAYANAQAPVVYKPYATAKLLEKVRDIMRAAP